MLNLIRKDIVLQKGTLLILLPVLFLYLLVGKSDIWVGVIFCIAIIMQSFALDEKSSTNLFLNSLPYTRKEIVSSKYIAAIAFTLLVVLTIVVGNLILHGELTAMGSITVYCKCCCSVYLICFSIFLSI